MRTTSRERVESIWEAVNRAPGARPAQVAGALGIHRSSVMRALPALDDAGLLLYEDERGGLWPCASGWTADWSADQP